MAWTLLATKVFRELVALCSQQSTIEESLQALRVCMARMSKQYFNSLAIMWAAVSSARGIVNPLSGMTLAFEMTMEVVDVPSLCVSFYIYDIYDCSICLL